MNIVLWSLLFLLAIYFVFTGIAHFVVPPDLPPQMAWMYELPTFLHYFGGTAEMLGGLGMVWHLTRNEFQPIVMNVILGSIAGFVAYGRWKSSPLKGKGNS